MATIVTVVWCSTIWFQTTCKPVLVEYTCQEVQLLTEVKTYCTEWEIVRGRRTGVYRRYKMQQMKGLK